MKLLSALALLTLLAPGAAAQGTSTPSAAVTLIGVWRGTSACTVRSSACKDEIVVYYITRGASGDSLTVDGRKIVGNAEQDMGAIGCAVAPKTGELTCVVPQGVWQFGVRHDALVGEFRLPDRTRFREVRAVRAR